VKIATKFGLVSHAGGCPGVVDSSAANVTAAVEGSLNRLGTDHIDLYYQHRVDRNTPRSCRYCANSASASYRTHRSGTVC
jgi:aryl-alcohol dehydrogenase-like predicted oxidoreductase